MFWRKLFCKHSYEIIYEKELPSAFEQMEDKLTGNLEGWGEEFLCLFRKKTIIFLQCTECNKTKEIVETNP